MGLYSAFPQDIGAMFALPESAIRPFLAPHIGQDANFVLMYAGLPLSRGTIKLASSDPLQAPLIDPNYFSHPADMAALVEGYKKTVGLYEGTKAWQKLGATLSPTHYPPCANFSLRGDEYIECFIRHWTTTMWHPTSTAKMGAADDPMAVLDSNLRYRVAQKSSYSSKECLIRTPFFLTGCVE
jgi:choline dehydrogenase-like flavoprotein